LKDIFHLIFHTNKNLFFKLIKKRVLLTSAPGALVKELKKETKVFALNTPKFKLLLH
jgi:hypothetical protein